MIDALPFPEVRGLLEYWAGKNAKGQLNKHEREALPPPNVRLPLPPAYVLEAMKRHKQEQANARRN